MPFLWEIGSPTFSVQIQKLYLSFLWQSGSYYWCLQEQTPESSQGWRNRTEASEVGPSSVDPFSISLYNLVTETKGIEIPVELNGTSLLMELDTDNSFFKGTPLKPSSTHLHTYTGHPVRVCGQLQGHLKYQDQNAVVPLMVVEGSEPSLFGRGWLSQVRLDWNKYAASACPM